MGLAVHIDSTCMFVAWHPKYSDTSYTNILPCHLQTIESVQEVIVVVLIIALGLTA